jgi:hypothetical protein
MRIRTLCLYFLVAFGIVPATTSLGPAQNLQLASVVTPSLPEERERWSKPRPEPITFDRSEWRRSAEFINEATTSFVAGACTVMFRRFWDRSLMAGDPVSARQTSRNVLLATRQVELRSYAQFEGHGPVQVLWLEGQGYDVKYIVRLIFRQCPDAVVDDVLTHVKVHW